MLKQTMVSRVSVQMQNVRLCTFILCFVVSKPPEVLIRNGHFTWKQQEEPGEEDERVFSTAGELTNINFCIETVCGLS